MSNKFNNLPQTLYADKKATIELARRLAGSLSKYDVILLSGDLGTGKTFFSQALIASLCNETNITSPTFTLVNTYANDSIWHFDLYRLNDKEELHNIGITEALRNIAIIEWPEIMLADSYWSKQLQGALLINFAYHTDETRTISIKSICR